MFKILLSMLLPTLFFFTIPGHASEASSTDKFRYPFYIGLSGGYGSTTWAGLVPTQSNTNPAMYLSTPVSIDEGGFVWGGFAGFELIPCFAIEGSYLSYPDATVTFSPKSLFTFKNHGQTSFTTHTEVVALMAKIMLIIPHTDVRVFSSLGPAGIHRHDVLANLWRLSPNFGAGINYNFTPHIMGELGANYTGGYGESELSPAQDYIPFLYSGFLRIAYRF